MPKLSGSKQATTEPATDDRVLADEVATLSPVEQMELIERIAEATPIHQFPPVSLRKAGESKEFDIEAWKKRTGYEPA